MFEKRKRQRKFLVERRNIHRRKFTINSRNIKENKKLIIIITFTITTNNKCDTIPSKWKKNSVIIRFLFGFGFSGGDNKYNKCWNWKRQQKNNNRFFYIYLFIITSFVCIPSVFMPVHRVACTTLRTCSEDDYRDDFHFVSF